MQNIVKCIFFVSIIYFSACTPYNSDKVNHQLIQGKWELVGVDHIAYDSIGIDYTKEQTLLIFDDNECIQIMTDIKDTMRFSFSIKNYDLSLYKDSILITSLGISALSQDSLALNLNGREHEYKKIE